MRLSKTVGGVLTTYLLDGGQVVTDTTNGTPVQTLYGPGTDHPLARNGEFFLPNSLGSTSLLTDSSGNAGQSYQYSPFGALLNAPTDSNPFQFTGRENDGDGLLYYRARYYNPGWGRFVSADPAGLGGGVNPYVYAGNDPVNYGDPSGQMDQGSLPPSAPINIPDYTGPTPNPDPNGFNEILTEGGPPGGGGESGNSALGFGAHSSNDLGGNSGGTAPPSPAASSGSDDGSTGTADSVEAAMDASDANSGNPDEPPDGGNIVSTTMPVPDDPHHHIFPQARRDWFNPNIGDIDQYTVQLPQPWHQVLHYPGWGGGWWNGEWRTFIAQNPNATAGQIWAHANGMMGNFGLQNLPVVPYPK